MAEMTALYLSDLLTGIFAALARRSTTPLSLRNNRLDLAMEQLGPEIDREAKEQGLRVRFRIKTDPVHRDSTAVHQALYEAAQRDLISLDNPEFQDVRLKITPDNAHLFFESLPGNPEMYERLASKLMCFYRLAA